VPSALWVFALCYIRNFEAVRFLWTLIILGWIGFSGYWYTCKVRCACGDLGQFSISRVSEKPAPAVKSEISTTEQAIVAKENGKEKEYEGRLLFNCNNAELIEGKDLPALMNSLKKKAEVMDSLHITGFYSLNEINASKYANLGLARANAIRETLKESLPAEMITINGMEKASLGIKCDEPFSAEQFMWQ